MSFEKNFFEQSSPYSGESSASYPASYEYNPKCPETLAYDDVSEYDYFATDGSFHKSPRVIARYPLDSVSDPADKSTWVHILPKTDENGEYARFEALDGVEIAPFNLGDRVYLPSEAENKAEAEAETAEPSWHVRSLKQAEAGVSFVVVSKINNNGTASVREFPQSLLRKYNPIITDGDAEKEGITEAPFVNYSQHRGNSETMSALGRAAGY